MAARSTQKKVGIFVEFNFEDSEFIYPYYRMKEAGFQVVAIGPEARKQYNGKNGVPVASDVSIADVKAADLCCVIVPGGWAPDYWRRDSRYVQLIKDMDQQGKPIATICHGAWLLCSARIIKGRRLTCFVSCKDDVENAGGVYENSAVVVDTNLITSRFPADLPEFCKAILRQINPK